MTLPRKPTYPYRKTTIEYYLETCVCVHCKGILNVPFQTESGMRICEECRKDIMSMDNYKCTDCGISLDNGSKTFKDRVFAKTLNPLEFHCNYHEAGCKTTLSVNCIYEHEKNCIYKIVPCSNEGCMEVVGQVDMKGHLEECPYGMGTCDFCTDRMKKVYLEQHLKKNCIMNMITCPRKGCGQICLAKDMDEHLGSECKFVTCKLCGHVEERKELSLLQGDHLKTTESIQLHNNHLQMQLDSLKEKMSFLEFGSSAEIKKKGWYVSTMIEELERKETARRWVIKNLTDKVDKTYNMYLKMMKHMRSDT